MIFKYELDLRVHMVESLLTVLVFVFIVLVGRNFVTHDVKI